MNRLNEDLKIDVGLVSQALNNTNATGRYFPMRGFMKAIAILSGGAMAATKTTKIEFLQAQDEAGTGSKAITGAEATVTANAAVSEATLTLLNVANADAVTINGLVFTGHTDTTTAASRLFKIDGNDAADATALAGLINDPTYGVPGVVASTGGTAVVTLRANGGGVAITVADPAATITVATTKAQAYVEIENFSLDHANAFTHVAAKVTTTANSNVAAVLLRGYTRDAVVQAVGASASA